MPRTLFRRVELEQGFMAASVVTEDPRSGVTTTGQELNEIDLSGDQYKDWNDSSWE
ncbi:MAG: hypothetical protein ACI3ZC_08205 [Candidatus Cryptobacteroides sp.]